MMKSIVCIVVLMLLASCINAVVEVKNLAGPPKEFASMGLPTPSQSADVQNSAALKVYLSPTNDANVLAQQVTLLVDSDSLFQFVIYSPYNESLILSLKNPKGQSVLLQGTQTYYPIGDQQVPGTQYSFKNPAKGAYVLNVQSAPLQADLYKKIAASETDAYVILWNEDSLATHTALNTYSLLTGNKVGLVSRVFTHSFSVSDLKKGLSPNALNGSVTSALMNVVLPDGQEQDEVMYDDGLHSDLGANDGVYGGLITATVAGQYIFSATIKGVNPDGDDYVRTTQQLVTVVEPDLTLTGSATGVVDSTKTKLNIYIAAEAPAGNKYKAYAEVWGTDSDGKEVAVAWIGGMSYVAKNDGMNSLSLQLDINWVSMAEAMEPLVLKNVVVQDIANYVPIAQFDQIPVKSDLTLSSALTSSQLLGKNDNDKITREMREGRRPTRLQAVNATSTTLLLVHGYCTNANPFAMYPEDWTNAQYYTNFNQNFNHDQFAMDVLEWAETFGPFAYVAHSQGGAVGLHIKNFYWTGLDLVEGGRLLQSVGTPYQGSSGAGSAADLAKLFGVLCGANQDLTKDGANLWLAGVTEENKALVHYYTSTYVKGKFFGDYCNLATNIVLKWPNDGVTEQEFGQLPGGQNEGNSEGWCHSVNMKYAAQCQDRDRNKIMNSSAARSIKS